MLEDRIESFRRQNDTERLHVDFSENKIAEFDENINAGV